jgi:hypothetical protein
MLFNGIFREVFIDFKKRVLQPCYVWIITETFIILIETKLFTDMKKTILTFIILFFANSIFAQISKFSGYSSGNNPHDSLLFDGAPEVFMNKEGEKNCGWKVKHVWGHVIGTRDTIKHNVYKECDWRKKEGVSTYVDQVRGQMKDGDEVYDGDTFEMTEGSFIQIEMSMGGDPAGPHPILILTAMCKKFIVPCGKGETKMDFDNGKYFWESTDYYLMYVGSQRCLIKNDGTKYSLETNNNEDIIKVYEGSVTVRPQKFKASASEEMQKLSEDYQNGKISLEEFTSKSKGLSEQILSDAYKVTNGVKVEAGYQISIGDKIGEVNPIGTDDNKWWDNKDYNK